MFSWTLCRASTWATSSSPGPKGEKPYHPHALCGVLAWGSLHGVRFARKLARLARQEATFVYLAGGQPDYRTLARFRRTNAAAFTAVFQETVLLALRLGLAKLGHVALDGTTLRANTSQHKAMSYGRMQQREHNQAREQPGGQRMQTGRASEEGVDRPPAEAEAPVQRYARGLLLVCGEFDANRRRSLARGHLIGWDGLLPLPVLLRSPLVQLGGDGGHRLATGVAGDQPDTDIGQEG